MKSFPVFSLLITLFLLPVPVFHPSPAAAQIEKEPHMFPSEHTIEVMQARECWAVAAVHCRDVIILERGTRSQGMRFSAEVLFSTIPGEIPSPWEGEQFAPDQGLLQAGTSFIMILICESAENSSSRWKIIQAEPLGCSDPQEAVERTEKSIRDRLPHLEGYHPGY